MKKRLLIVLAGLSLSAQMVFAEPAPVARNDAESALWEEVQKGNLAEDYQAYLSQYPEGRYLALAKARLSRLKSEARAAAAAEDKRAWDAAAEGATLNDYETYLVAYPKGRFSVLAKGRISKLKKEAAAVAAQEQRAREAEEARLKREAATRFSPGKTFRDCADCPEMVVIPAGSFTMGGTSGDEAPAHRVTISKPFAVGKFEVTQAQWRAVMGNNPSRFTACGHTCPVEQVSWNDIQVFLQRLNAKTGKQYRLPTEAEWEFACYGGSQTEYCGGDNIDAVAWYGGSFRIPPTGNSGDRTHPVGQKQANGYGLYDMSGNVWEWMQDKWDSEHDWRVLRGGSWYFEPQFARAANRGSGDPADRNLSIGFRLARTLP